MGVRDKSIDYLRQIHRIPSSAFHIGPHQHTIRVADDDSAATNGVAVYFDEDGAEGSKFLFVSPTNTAGTELSASGVAGSLDTGAPTGAELSSFGVGGLSISAAGDMASTIDLTTGPLFDPTAELGIRVLYAQNAAGSATDDVTWVVTYDQWDFGEAIGAPSTQLSTVIGEQANIGGTTLIAHRSPRGIINANVFNMDARNGGFTWKVECDAMGFAADELQFLGIEIDYQPRLTMSSEEAKDVYKNLASS